MGSAFSKKAPASAAYAVETPKEEIKEKPKEEAPTPAPEVAQQAKSTEPAAVKKEEAADGIARVASREDALGSFKKNSSNNVVKKVSSRNIMTKNSRSNLVNRQGSEFVLGQGTTLEPTSEAPPVKSYTSAAMELVKGENLYANYTQFEIGRLCIFFEGLCEDDDCEIMPKEAFFGLFPDFVSSQGTNPKQLELQRKTLEKIFRSFDRNKDGKLDLKEFLGGFSYWHNSISNFQDTLLIYFKLFDEEQKGLMDIHGFKEMIEHMVVAEAYKLQKKWAEQNEHKQGESTEQMSKDIDEFVTLVFNDVDEDGSGEIDFDEFKQWVDGHTVQAMMLGDSPETLLKSFRLFDIDGSGTISQDEFKEMIASTHNGSMDMQDMSSIRSKIDNFAVNVFKVVDEDNSGEIEYEEFENWVKENKGRAETISEAGDTLAEITGLLRKAANVMQSSRPKKHAGETNTLKRKGSLESRQAVKGALVANAVPEDKPVETPIAEDTEAKTQS